jgi:hypothetical protein
MIKNRAKYAATAGWAEWVGNEPKPYGKDAGFSSECVACHAPLSRMTMFSPWQSKLSGAEMSGFRFIGRLDAADSRGMFYAECQRCD